MAAILGITYKAESQNTHSIKQDLPKNLEIGKDKEFVKLHAVSFNNPVFLMKTDSHINQPKDISTLHKLVPKQETSPKKDVQDKTRYSIEKLNGLGDNIKKSKLEAMSMNISCNVCSNTFLREPTDTTEALCNACLKILSNKYSLLKGKEQEQEAKEIAAILGITHVADSKNTSCQKKLKLTKLAKPKIEIQEVLQEERLVELPAGFSITHVAERDDLNPKMTTSGKSPRKEKIVMQCNVCSETFLRRMALKEHMKTHKNSRGTKDKKIDRALCNVCSKTFGNRYILRSHMKLHDPESGKYKPGLDEFKATSFICDVCSETLPSNLYLKRHMAKTHSDKHHVDCSNCQKSISYLCITKHKKLCQMSKEEKIEYKEKNRVQCGECGKIVGNRTKLNRHVRFIHRKEKLFRCNHCEREDYSKENLKTHIKGCHREANLDESISNIQKT